MARPREALRRGRSNPPRRIESSKPGDPLIAYEVSDPSGMAIEPAPPARDWMDRSAGRFAYRCLPMVIANQSGWLIPCPVRFSARWNGGPRRQDLRLWFARGSRDARIQSHFGEGIITISLPYLFRTPPGINLWVKGPTNCVRDGVQPLEGVVEADWTEATFTMNWKLTRPGLTVRFEAGEPICMIVPVARGLAERLDPITQPLERDEELANRYGEWSRRRAAFIDGLTHNEPEVVRRGWEKDYMQGLGTNGRPFGEHQTRVHLRAFRKLL